MWDYAFRGTAWKLKARPGTGLEVLMQESPNRVFKNTISSYLKLKKIVQGKVLLLPEESGFNIPHLILFSKAQVIRLPKEFSFKTVLGLLQYCRDSKTVEFTEGISLRLCSDRRTQEEPVAYILYFYERSWHLIPTPHVIGADIAG